MNRVDAMFLDVFSNQAVAAAGTVYSQAFEIGDDNAPVVSESTAAGTVATITFNASVNSKQL
jgi:hypothetical protein